MSGSIHGKCRIILFSTDLYIYCTENKSISEATEALCLFVGFRTRGVMKVVSSSERKFINNTCQRDSTSVFISLSLFYRSHHLFQEIISYFRQEYSLVFEQCTAYCIDQTFLKNHFYLPQITIISVVRSVVEMRLMSYMA